MGYSDVVNVELSASPMSNNLIRCLVALLAGLIIIVISLAAAYGALSDMLFPQLTHTRNTLIGAAYLVDTYKTNNGSYPDDLSPLVYRNDPTNSKQFDFRDAWFNPLIYRVTDTGYELISYGADHSPGGVGLNADQSISSTRSLPTGPTKPTAYQFLISSQSHYAWTIAIIGGVVAFAICCIPHAFLQRAVPAANQWPKTTFGCYFLTIAMITSASVIIGTLMIVLYYIPNLPGGHVAAPSGH